MNWRRPHRVAGATTLADIATMPIHALPAAEVRCIEHAAHYYRLPVAIVTAVRRQEAGRTGAVHENSNGTIDIGPMQINSIHLPTLARYGITFEKLRDDLCVNIHVGAWMLAKSIRARGDLWKGVGDYHSATPSLNVSYQLDVWRRIQQMARAMQHAEFSASVGDKVAETAR